MRSEERSDKLIILDGKQTAAILNAALKNKIDQMERKPQLDIILIGDHPSSQTYVKAKLKTAASLSIKTRFHHLNAEVSNQEIEQLIKDLNCDDQVDGILLQLPVPKHLNGDHLIDLIDESKDVDGFNVYNQGRLFQKRPATIAATPKGILMLLDHYQINVEGLNVCVVGRSQIVGAPIAKLLLDRNATVTIVHSKTKDLAFHTKNADLLVVAIGVPNFIKAPMVKNGAIIIDVGINKVDGKLCGDVDFEQVATKASYITKVPGGVGPMTICALFDNLYELSTKKGIK